MPALGYRPGLDGLPALAVTAVLLFHLDRLPGGHLGADAFFVVSGWLTTSKVLSDVDRSGTIDSRKFWTQRLCRLMPESMVALITIALVWPFADIDVPSRRRDIGWAAVSLSNWGIRSSAAVEFGHLGRLPVRQIMAGLDVRQVDLPWLLVAEGLDGLDGRPDGVHLAPGLNERFVAEVVALMLDTVRQP